MVKSLTRINAGTLYELNYAKISFKTDEYSMGLHFSSLVFVYIFTSWNINRIPYWPMKNSKNQNVFTGELQVKQF
jgi:hypothetical protein